MPFQKKIRLKKKKIVLKCPPGIRVETPLIDDLSYNSWRFCVWQCEGYDAIGQCETPGFSDQKGADITTGNPADFCTPTNLNNPKEFALRGDDGKSDDALYPCCQKTIDVTPVSSPTPATPSAARICCLPAQTDPITCTYNPYKTGSSNWDGKNHCSPKSNDKTTWYWTETCDSNIDCNTTIPPTPAGAPTPVPDIPTCWSSDFSITSNSWNNYPWQEQLGLTASDYLPKNDQFQWPCATMKTKCIEAASTCGVFPSSATAKYKGWISILRSTYANIGPTVDLTKCSVRSDINATPEALARYNLWQHIHKNHCPTKGINDNGTSKFSCGLKIASDSPYIAILKKHKVPAVMDKDKIPLNSSLIISMSYGHGWGGDDCLHFPLGLFKLSGNGVTNEGDNSAWYANTNPNYSNGTEASVTDGTPYFLHLQNAPRTWSLEISRISGNNITQPNDTAKYYGDNNGTPKGIMIVGRCESGQTDYASCELDPFIYEIANSKVNNGAPYVSRFKYNGFEMVHLNSTLTPIPAWTEANIPPSPAPAPVNCCLKDSLMKNGDSWVKICRDITDESTCKEHQTFNTKEPMCDWSETPKSCPPKAPPDVPTPSTCIDNATDQCGYIDWQKPCCPDGWDATAGVPCNDCGYCDTSDPTQAVSYCKWVAEVPTPPTPAQTPAPTPATTPAPTPAPTPATTPAPTPAPTPATTPTPPAGSNLYSCNSNKNSCEISDNGTYYQKSCNVYCNKPSPSPTTPTPPTSEKALYSCGSNGSCTSSTDGTYYQKSCNVYCNKPSPSLTLPPPTTSEKALYSCGSNGSCTSSTDSNGIYYKNSCLIYCPKS